MNDQALIRNLLEDNDFRIWNDPEINPFELMVLSPDTFEELEPVLGIRGLFVDFLDSEDVSSDTHDRIINKSGITAWLDKKDTFPVPDGWRLHTETTEVPGQLKIRW